MKWVLLLLLLQAGLSQPVINEFKITADIGLTHVSEVMEVTITNPSEKSWSNFTHSLSYNPGTVSAYVNGEKVEATVIKDINTYRVVVPVFPILEPGTRANIKLRFRADPLVKVSEDKRNFLFTFSPEYETNVFTLKVVLPAGAILAEKKTAAQSLPVVFPNAAISTDGRRTSVEWSITKIDEEKLFLMTFELPITTQTTNYNYLLIIPFLIVLVAVYATNIRWKSTIEALDEGEQLILNEIRKKQGISERELVDITKFNKVKIYRIVKRLEHGNMIKVEKRVNRTRIYLTDKLKGVINPLSSLKNFFSSFFDFLKRSVVK